MVGGLTGGRSRGWWVRLEGGAWLVGKVMHGGVVSCYFLFYIFFCCF